MYRPILTLSLLAVLAVSANAAPTPTTTHAKAAKPAKLICPVTGDTIASVKDAAGHSTYKGKTYYFCCGGCKPEFDKNPAQYFNPDGTVKVKPSADHGM